MIKTITRVLKIFARNGLFEDGVELIGSWCFYLYQRHLGVPEFPLRTQDIDFLIPNPYQGKSKPGFIGDLEKAGFKCDHKSDGSLYLWNGELKIEFITPEKGKGSSYSIKIKQLGLRAIPLRFVMVLLDKPIKIVEGGVHILIPRPSRFCLHKLVIASRRRKKEKYLKDLQQAIGTSVIVKERELKNTFKVLPKKWKKAAFKVLEKSKDEFSLWEEEINKLENALQSGTK